MPHEYPLPDCSSLVFSVLVRVCYLPLCAGRFRPGRTSLNYLEISTCEAWPSGFDGAGLPFKRSRNSRWLGSVPFHPSAHEITPSCLTLSSPVGLCLCLPSPCGTSTFSVGFYIPNHRQVYAAGDPLFLARVGSSMAKSY